MPRYMIQHKSFSLFMFFCNMVLFAGLFSTPVFLIYYSGIIADKYSVIIEAVVLIPAVYLSYRFATYKDKNPDRDAVAIKGRNIIVGSGLLSVRSGPRQANAEPTRVKIDCKKVNWAQLKRSTGRNALSGYYELVLSSDKGIISIPLNDWILRNLTLVEIDSHARYRPGRREYYPGFSFVSEVYRLLKDVPWKVTAYHTGKYETLKTDYEYHGINNPWAKKYKSKTPAQNNKKIFVIVIMVFTFFFMGVVGFFYYNYQQSKMELKKQQAMERLIEEKTKSNLLNQPH